MRKGLVREQAYVLGRMGNAKKALAVFINQLEDMQAVCTYYHLLVLFHIMTQICVQLGRLNIVLRIAVLNFPIERQWSL